MGFQTISTTTAYQAVAQQIRKAILDSALDSRTPIPSERVLADQLGVGRSTVREALRQLHAEGLLIPGGRTTPMRPADPSGRFCEALVQVAIVRKVSLGELGEVRRSIESRALELAAASPLPDRLDPARAALAAMEDPSLGIEAFHDADLAFHLALVEASGNPLLPLLMTAVRSGMRDPLLALLSTRLDASRARLVREHGRMLRAVERGEVDRVADLLADHLEGFYGG